jgi:hypothetical protein
MMAKVIFSFISRVLSLLKIKHWVQMQSKYVIDVYSRW